MRRTCLLCAKVLNGRRDKKFCNEQCRAAYHNRKRRNARPEVAETHHKLRLNHAILRQFRTAGHGRPQRKELLMAGFDATFLTSLQWNSAGELYYFCYDEGYRCNSTGTCYLLSYQDLLQERLQSQAQQSRLWVLAD